MLDEVDRSCGTEGNRVHYLATVPKVFDAVVGALGRHGLNQRRRRAGFARVVIEKPYGRDLRSAEELDAAVHANFDESQVYRIDHYLGKETVQNVLALRFANAIFEPVWNRRYVDHVQITVAESLGVGSPGRLLRRRRARSATSCRTTCSRCWRSPRWNRRPRSTPREFVTRR